tara:strand:+ start:1378 stop:3027 length:1650 start_codon:yes stop_codon:yes gene_type:complete
MASEIDKDQNLNESITSFPNPNNTGHLQPATGKSSGFFGKFFSTRGRKPKRGGRLSGDTLKAVDLFSDLPGIGISKGMVHMPQIEYDKKKRYADYEKMDEYPEIGAALDIYADDGTQKHLNGDVLHINTASQAVKLELESFIKNTNLRQYIWDIFRNVAKYGDCFVENIVDLNNTSAGIQRLKVLNPNYITRVENQYGYLQKFMQEVPDVRSGGGMMDAGANTNGSGKFLDLNKDQISHFRIHTSDPNFYPYGKSIVFPAINAWRSLKLMEDAMLIYRLARAPERRVFYVDTGNLPTSKVEMYMERLKQKFKKEKFFDPTSGQINERYNPLSTDEDFFVPVKGKGNGTKIETLPGAQNLGETDDVKYFRDKLLAALKVPQDFIVEKEQSPERKSNLSQLDIKFSRAVGRIQREVETSLNLMVKRHLTLRGFDKNLTNAVEVLLCPPSDLQEKRRLELDEMKTRVVQAVKGLEMFPPEYIYENYFQMNENEIKQIEDRMSEIQEEQAEAEMQQMQAQQEAMGVPEPGSELGGAEMGGGEAAGPPEEEPPM